MLDKGRKILLNAGYLLLGNVGARALGALVTILVARFLGAESYGALAVALAFANLAAYGADLGLGQTFIREGSKTGADIPALAGSALKLRLLFALAVTLLVLVLVPLLYPGPMGRLILWATVPGVWGAAFQGAGAAYFQLAEKMQYTALIRGITALANGLALLTCIYLNTELVYFAAGFGVSQLTGGLFSALLLVGRCSLRAPWHPGLARELVYFTLTGALTMALPQLGPLVLQKVSSLKEVGYFAAAYRIPGLLYMVPGTVAGAFYPVLFRRGHRDRAGHRALATVQLQLMTVLGAALALPLLLYPDTVLVFLFGPGWQGGQAVATLQILALMVVLQSINYPLADALTTSGRQKYRTLCLGSATLLAIMLHSWLGAQGGARGAALAVIAVETWLLAGFALGLPGGGALLKKNAVPLLLAALVLAGGLGARHLGLGAVVGLWLPSLTYLALAVVLNKKQWSRL